MTRSAVRACRLSFPPKPTCHTAPRSALRVPFYGAGAGSGQADPHTSPGIVLPVVLIGASAQAGRCRWGTSYKGFDVSVVLSDRFEAHSQAS